jgi:hypothetical protein
MLCYILTYALINYDNVLYLKFEATKRWSEAVNQSRTRNTMDIRKIPKQNEKYGPLSTAQGTTD